MKELIDFLSQEEEWRKQDLTILLKMISIERNTNYKDILLKYSAPMIYAIWEGFIRDSLEHYSLFINRNEEFEKDMNLITQIMDHNKLLKEKKLNSFESKKQLLIDIKTTFEKPIFSDGRPSDTNLDFKKSNNLLKKFNLKSLEKKYQIKLNNLVKIRHTIVHGENPDNVPVDDEKMIDYIKLVENLIDNVRLIIEEKIEIK
jgi:hypothetical protein